MRRATTHEIGNWTRAWIALAVGFSLCAPGFAQRSGGPRVAAQLSQGVVRLGEQVVLVVVAENADTASIVDFPRVDGLTLSRPSGPSTEENMRWVNGRRTVTRKLYWKSAVRPEREGEFEIPPIELLVNGKRARTRPRTLRVVRDLKGADIGFIEIHPIPARVVEGQPFNVEIVFGWDIAVDVAFADLALPWWDDLPGALDLGDRPVATGARVINKNVFVNSSREVTVQELEVTTRPGSNRKFRTLRLVKRYLPARSGKLDFPMSFLEFGQWARRTSFLSTRPEKGKSHFVQTDPFALEVIPLPVEGQPFDFSGAVGVIEARAGVDGRDVVAGDSIKLTVDWTGAANLEFFEPPDPGRLDEFRDFRVYGQTEEKSFERRRVVYDLAPVSAEVHTIPALPLTLFDTERGEYRTVATEPIPIRVRPLEGAVSLGAEEEEASFAGDIRDIDARPLAEAVTPVSAVPGDAALAALLAVIPLAWIGARTTVRRRRGDPDAPLERRRRKARRALARALRGARDGKARLDAFTTFLAARTREPDEAWIGREAGEWNRGQAAALTHDDARAVGELLASLERAAFGGGPAVGNDEVLGAADQAMRAGL